MKTLGADVGASLAAEGIELAPISHQIGRSGMPQHMAVVELAIETMAITNDPDAAVFECVGIGIMVDWRGSPPAVLQAFGEGK
jgi:electron transfer flavoprotein alpha subunit